MSGSVHVSEDGRWLSAGVDPSPGLATAVVRALDAAGVLVDNIEVRQPSLDDVFFSLTGGHIEEEAGESESEPPSDGGAGSGEVAVDGSRRGDGDGGDGGGQAIGSADLDGQDELEGAHAR